MGVGRRMGTKMIFTSFSSSFFFFAATHAFPSDGPLNMEALNMLNADAVKFGAGAKDNKWFEAVDAKTLDGMITEMNTMNRWFAKVVKYWDDFTSGGDGAKVLAEQGKGINEDEPVDGDVGGDDEPAADGEPTDGEPTDGEPTDGEPADGEDKPAADGKDPAADGDGEPAADGDGEPTDGEDKPADGEDEPAGGDEEPAADGEEDPAADGDEKPAADGDEEPADGGEDKEGGDDAKTD